MQVGVDNFEASNDVPIFWRSHCKAYSEAAPPAAPISWCFNGNCHVEAVRQESLEENGVAESIYANWIKEEQLGSNTNQDSKLWCSWMFMGMMDIMGIHGRYSSATMLQKVELVASPPIFRFIGRFFQPSCDTAWVK